MTRISSAALAVIRTDRPQPPTPPEGMSPAARAVFVQIVASAPAGSLLRVDAAPLRAYAEAIALCNEATAHLDAEGVVTAKGKASAWLHVRNTACRQIALLGTKLRLTPASRERSRTAGRRKATPPSAYEVMCGEACDDDAA